MVDAFQDVDIAGMVWGEKEKHEILGNGTDILDNKADMFVAKAQYMKGIHDKFKSELGFQEIWGNSKSSINHTSTAGLGGPF